VLDVLLEETFSTNLITACEKITHETMRYTPKVSASAERLWIINGLFKLTAPCICLPKAYICDSLLLTSLKKSNPHSPHATVKLMVIILLLISFLLLTCFRMLQALFDSGGKDEQKTNKLTHFD
jgi:hypothetical protein